MKKMLGIHVTEGTAEGWFGHGIGHAILSIFIIIALVGGVAAGIFFAVRPSGTASPVNAPNGPVTVNPQTPGAPEPTQITPTPVTPTPTTPTPSQNMAEGKVWTVEELAGEFKANPNRFQRGTVLQVSGVLKPWNKISSLYLGPPLLVYDPQERVNTEFWVMVIVDETREREMREAWLKIPAGSRVIFRAAFSDFGDARYPSYGRVVFTNSTIISVTPPADK